MKPTLAALAASTAFIALFGLPAFSAARLPAVTANRLAASPIAAGLGSGEQALPLVLIDSDEGEDEDEGADDECGDDDDADEDGADEDGAGCGAAVPPAPSGSVAPPANGLFGSGAAPKVQIN